MRKLTDESPYALLGVEPSSSKKDIRKAFTQKSRERKTGRERRNLRQAFDSLRSPERRALADALTPNFNLTHGTTNALSTLQAAPSETPDWSHYVDSETVLNNDWQTLCSTTLAHMLEKMETTSALQELSTQFDGLEQFLEDWLA